MPKKPLKAAVIAARFGVGRFNQSDWDVDEIDVSAIVVNRNDKVTGTVFDKDFVFGVVQNRNDIVSVTIQDLNFVAADIHNADDVVDCKILVTPKKNSGSYGLYLEMPHVKQWWEREEEKVEEALEAIEQEIEQGLPMLAMPQPPQIDPATQRMIQALMRRGTHHMDVADEDDIEAILQFL